METELTPDAANELHRWVVMTEGCLNRTKPDEDGFIRPKRERRLNAHVSGESIHRSMLIWDRILKAVQSSGFKIRIEKEPPYRTVATVDDEELRFWPGSGLSPCDN